MDESGFFFALWFSFRALFITLIILFLLNGLDDLFVDFLFYGRKLYRLVFRRRVVVPVTVERLNAVPEQPAAIMIPAWDESAVIRRMLLNTIGTLHYRNYRIFVGTYPNDEATRMEVEKVREIYANVEAIVTPADGPTNKADCLNWVYQGIRTY
jgi:adsorption protein B